MIKVVKGNYTIEAALIFPTILFIIIGLIYLGFYLHDKDKIEAILDETLIKGRNLVQNESNMQTGIINYETYYKRGLLYTLEDNLNDKKQEIYNYMQNQLNRGLFIADVKTINVEISHTAIDLEVSAEMVLPFLGLQPLFAGSGTNVTEKNSISIESNAEFIRIFDIFFSVAEKVPVIREILNKLQSILMEFVS